MRDQPTPEQTPERIAGMVQRIREVYPTDKPKCPWCGVRSGKHNFDCPTPDIGFLLLQVDALTATLAHLTQAINPKGTATADMLPSLAAAHRQDSELLDDCELAADGPTLREVIVGLRKRAEQAEATLAQTQQENYFLRETEAALLHERAYLEAMLARVKAQTEWQPIETAPEATWVLVFVPNYGINIATMTRDPNIIGPNGAFWFIRDDDDPCRPTHWAALVDPPVSSSTETT